MSSLRWCWGWTEDNATFYYGIGTRFGFFGCVRLLTAGKPEDVLAPYLRPTQETDPPFVGTLNETIAYLKEPTHETDPEPIGEPGVDWVDEDHPCKRCGQIMPHTHDLRPTLEP